MSSSRVQTPILSMTGFGKSEGSIQGTRYRVEMKSLNHRYLEIKVRLPRELSSAEIPLRGQLQKELGRGSIELKVERLVDDSDPGATAINIELARKYYAELEALRLATGIETRPTIADLLRCPDLFEGASGAQELSSEDAWSGLSPIIREATHSLLSMRSTEGQALGVTLLGSISELRTSIETLRKLREKSASEYPIKLRESIERVMEQFKVAREWREEQFIETRLSQELALLAEKTDVEEELVRFAGHLDHFEKTLREKGPIGKKLDFLLQELGREINTLGNKAQSMEMSSHVVAVKVKIDQLREQSLNIK